MNTLMPVTTVQPVRPVDYSGQQLDLIRRTVASDCTADEFDLFIEVCRRVGLDPFRKQIYAVVYSKRHADKRKMSIITGIDGFRAVAARNGDYRPDEDEAEIEYDQAQKSPTNPLGIVKAVVNAHKYGPDRQWHKIKGRAYWDEYAPLKEVWREDERTNKRQPTGEFELDATSNWFRMGRVMLPKCAEAQALRKGWPEDLSGVYSPEEMAQADALEVSATAAAEAFDQERRMRAINGAHSITVDLQDSDHGLRPIPIGEFADRVLERVRQFDDADKLRHFKEHNRHSLNEFWARAKSDALELKTQLEAMEKGLEKAG